MQAGVGIIFAGLEGNDRLFVDAMVQGGPAEASGMVAQNKMLNIPSAMHIIFCLAGDLGRYVSLSGQYAGARHFGR